jgi:teichuronic acid biosynthesis glycosyltransferase TuaG
MSTRDLVSIITPAYNAAPFVKQTIESVQGQSYRSWEMIVVDDCSSDETATTVEKCARFDSRVRLIVQEHNQGPAMARNAAIASARGRFIAFLDSDDWWLPGKLQQQLDFMNRTQAPISYTQFRRVSADGSRLGHCVNIPNQLNYHELLRNTAMATSTVIVDRRHTGEFRMVDTYYDDYVLWLSLLKQGFIARGLKEDLVRYRVLDGSVSRNKSNSALKVWQTYRQVEKLSFGYAAWCLAGYALNGLRKYRHF